jgi:hypothetical protein
MALILTALVQATFYLRVLAPAERTMMNAGSEKTIEKQTLPLLAPNGR